MDKDTKNTNNGNGTYKNENITIALNKLRKIKSARKYRGWYFVKTY